MEAPNPSEISTNICQTKERNIPRKTCLQRIPFLQESKSTLPYASVQRQLQPRVIFTTKNHTKLTSIRSTVILNHRIVCVSVHSTDMNAENEKQCTKHDRIWNMNYQVEKNKMKILYSFLCTLVYRQYCIFRVQPKKSKAKRKQKWDRTDVCISGTTKIVAQARVGGDGDERRREEKG